jgi:hypothetical protein
MTDHHVEYAQWLGRLQASLDTRTRHGQEPLFLSRAQGLDAVLLAALPDTLRQAHHCATCARFLACYGALVTLDMDGTPHAALWNPDDAMLPERYRPAVRALAAQVEHAEIDTQFLSSHAVLGVPMTGHWHHFSVTPAAVACFQATPEAATADDAMTQSRHRFGQAWYAALTQRQPICMNARDRGWHRVLWRAVAT